MTTFNWRHRRTAKRLRENFIEQYLGLRKPKNPSRCAIAEAAGSHAADQQLHIGVEPNFQPAKKAHPAFAVDDLESLHENLARRGIKITRDDALPGVKRFYAEDPWRNRLEFLEARSR